MPRRFPGSVKGPRDTSPVPASDSYMPQLAKLYGTPPAGSDWTFEIKHDGYRMGLRWDGKAARLISRNKKDWTKEFPEISAAASGLRCKSALLDGEICIVDERGVSDFGRLQNLLADRTGLVFYAFDLLERDGADLRALPLEQRRAALVEVVPKIGLIRISQAIEGDGTEILRAACQLGAEGIVAKRRGARYWPGERGDSWRKIKCTKRQEFVVGGWIDLVNSDDAIGSLLVGYYDGKQLIYCGHVGTGFTREVARELRSALAMIDQPGSPFSNEVPREYAGAAHWTQPRVVVEVAFTEITRAEHMLRHASYKGLRLDKDARDVKLEGTE